MRAVLIICALLLLQAAPSRATSFIVLPMEQTVSTAKYIVRGTVTRSFPKKVVHNNSTRVFTYTDLRVLDVIKGKIGSGVVLVRQMGGEAGGIGMIVPGTAKFKEGEEVVLLLAGPNHDDSYDVAGMMMGKFQVQTGADGQEYLKGPALEHATNQVVHADGHEGHDGTAREKKWTVGRLKQLVAAQADGRQLPSESKNPTISPPAAKKPPPALQLQNDEGEVTEVVLPPGEEKPASFLTEYLIWILGGILAIGVIFFLRKFF